MRVKITVLKTEFYPEIAEEYLTEGKEAGQCPILEVGNTFIYEGDAVMPKGMCEWAWQDIFSVVRSAAAGGGRDNTWYKYPGTSIACCEDGIRPVIFKVEPIE